MSVRKKEAYSIQSVDNALDVLEALCEEGDEVRVSQLSQRLGMHKVSLFRYLATFENRGYVERTGDSRKYRLGLSAYEIGQKFLLRMSLLRKAKPVLERLARECNEALYLAVPKGAEILLLDMVDTTQQVRIMPMVGNRHPMAGTAAGLVILAHSEAARNSCGTEEITPLQAALQNCRRQGGCWETGGFGEGITSLAVPLLDAQGQIPGSLCMVGPEFRLTAPQVDGDLLPKLIEAGVVISSKLGYVGHFIGKGA